MRTRGRGGIKNHGIFADVLYVWSLIETFKQGYILSVSPVNQIGAIIPSLISLAKQFSHDQGRDSQEENFSKNLLKNFLKWIFNLGHVPTSKFLEKILEYTKKSVHF